MLVSSYHIHVTGWFEAGRDAKEGIIFVCYCTLLWRWDHICLRYHINIPIKSYSMLVDMVQ